MYGQTNMITKPFEASPTRLILISEAARLFMNERRKALWDRLLARIGGRNLRLLDLNQVRRQTGERSRSYLGSQAVPIDRIRGSENRCDDFDSNLRPLGKHTRQRWLNIAVARLDGTSLPPVELIHLDGFYFIRDGHHRVSVARALGERFVDAIVLGW